MPALACANYALQVSVSSPLKERQKKRRLQRANGELRATIAYKAQGPLPGTWQASNKCQLLLFPHLIPQQPWEVGRAGVINPFIPQGRLRFGNVK